MQQKKSSTFNKRRSSYCGVRSFAKASLPPFFRLLGLLHLSLFLRHTTGGKKYVSILRLFPLFGKQFEKFPDDESVISVLIVTQKI
jgi:hypothetical protein